MSDARELCPNCHRPVLSRTCVQDGDNTAPNPGAAPSEGDWTVCNACLCALVFDARGVAHVPSAELEPPPEVDELRSRIVHAERLRAFRRGLQAGVASLGGPTHVVEVHLGCPMPEELFELLHGVSGKPLSSSPPDGAHTPTGLNPEP